jgi:hypothetical protein
MDSSALDRKAEPVSTEPVKRIGSRILRTETAEILSQVAYLNRRFICMRNGKEMAALVSMDDLATLDALTEEAVA